MSKRSRKEFEGIKPDNTTIDLRESKRVRKNINTATPNKNNNITLSENFECPICYEEFSYHIYQCVEGHLLCHICRPKFNLCPTCRVSLSSNIRNRILEQILSTKQSITTTNNNNNNNNNFKCKLCNELFLSLNKRNEHYNICENRLIKCPFIDCKWIDKFSKFCIHTQDIHHTSNQSKQLINIFINNNNEKIYKFNHAIKFPFDTLQRKESDFVWPKIITFNNGIKFFILSRFNNGYVTVFIRLIKLIKLDKNDLNNLGISYLNNGLKNINICGKYFIELKMKNKNNDNKKDKDENNNNNIPLRWPCDLYPIQIPFNYEIKMKQILKIHHSIFTKYWTKQKK
eukprot:361864_1